MYTEGLALPSICLPVTVAVGSSFGLLLLLVQPNAKQTQSNVNRSLIACESIDILSHTDLTNLTEERIVSLAFAIRMVTYER